MDANTFCADTQAIWQFVGTIIKIFQVIIPVIVVIWGVVYLGKAVISDDDKLIKEAWTKLIKKVIVAICIFFVPMLVKGIFSLINSFNGLNWQDCINYLGF